MMMVFPAQTLLGQLIVVQSYNLLPKEEVLVVRMIMSVEQEVLEVVIVIAPLRSM